MTHSLAAPLALLVRDYEELRARGEALVLATVVATEGSTYRKAGTQMLITAGGALRGLLSGGCLEVDLVDRARRVLGSGTPEVAAYDMRGEDDLLFGLGSGCEGAMQVLLQRVGPDEGWQPLAQLAALCAGRQRAALALVVDGPEAGHGWGPEAATAGATEPSAVAAARHQAEVAAEAALVETEIDGKRCRVLVMPVLPPPLLLLLGAGPDAQPLARQALALGLAVTVADHRPALAQPERFPGCVVRHVEPERLAVQLPLAAADAAVVMSHFLPADAAYLRALAGAAAPGYIGLLGPAARRERLLGEIGDAAGALRGRLRAPVGLDIGARTPEAIAVAVIAEIHAWFAGRAGSPFSETAET